MQKRKLEDSEIFELYNRMIEGESLTALSKEIGLDRGTLRSYIKTVVEPVLTENEKNEFYQIANKNFRGNSTVNKRQNRNGLRKKAAEEIEKSEEIKKLAEYGVTPQQIEELYNRLRSNTRTALAKDTYIYKYLEHLNFFAGLGFSTEEVFEIFMRRPKLFSESANNLKKKFNSIAKDGETSEQLKKRIIDDPWLDLDTNNKTRLSNNGGER